MSQINILKDVIKDIVSLIYQGLGRPHNRTRQQIQKIRASHTEPKTSRQRIQLIARATHQSEADIQAATDEKLPELISEHFPNHIMGIQDRTSLHTLVRALELNICVETGVSGGASSFVILQELHRQQRGKLISIDIESPNAGFYGEVIPSHLRERWELRLQSKQPLLPSLLEELGEIDFFLHDSRHVLAHMCWEYELAWRYLSAGGCLASHDVNMTTAFEDFYQQHKSEIADGGAIGEFGFYIKKK